MTSEHEKELISEAMAARENSVAPFSRYRVGAALRTPDGRIYRGCNVESCTYGLTMCAERVALFAAIAAGERHFVAAAVVTQSEPPAPPCGSCRHLLWENCGDIPIVLSSVDGTTRRFQLSALYPEPFSLDPS